MAQVATIHDDLYLALQRLDGVGTLYLKTGEYILSRPIDINGHIDIVGSGVNSTIITYVGTEPAFRVNTGIGLGTWNWSIQNLTVKGNDVGSYGIKLGQMVTSPKSANTGFIRDCKITGFTVAGLWLRASQINNFYNVDISDNPGIGVLADTGAGNTDTNFIGCFIRKNGSHGIYANNGSHISFRNCTIEANEGYGVWLHAVDANDNRRNWMFDDCHFENNQLLDFKISSDISGIWSSAVIKRCHMSGLYGGNTYHIHVGKCLLDIENTYYTLNLGADDNSSANIVRITSHETPEWILGGGNSPVKWKQRDAADGDINYKNDGAGNWVQE